MIGLTADERERCAILYIRGFRWIVRMKKGNIVRAFVEKPYLEFGYGYYEWASNYPTKKLDDYMISYKNVSKREPLCIERVLPELNELEKLLAIETHMAMKSIKNGRNK